MGCVIGGLPGSLYGTYPIIVSLQKAGAEIGAVVGFVTAKACGL